MTAVSYVPPNVLPPLLQKFAPLLKRKWFRQLVLAPPTITRRRFSNKTEDYGVFKPSLIAHIGQLSIYVQDIGRSRQWYETLGGLRHSRTCEQEPHPFKPGWTIRCCYMSATEHEEWSRVGRGARARRQSYRSLWDEFLSHRVRA